MYDSFLFSIDTDNSSQYDEWIQRKSQGRLTVTWRTLVSQAQRAHTILILSRCHWNETFTKKARQNFVLVTQQHKGKQSHMSHQKGKWQWWRYVVVSHKQTLFSSPWMPLWGYMKITSLPYMVWLPCRSLACLIWAFPISWLPIRTLTRLAWVPFMPSRRLSGPGPRWLLPSGWVPLLVSIFLNLLLPGFVPGFKLRQWPSTVIFKGNSRIVTRIGVCQDRSVGRIERSLFWSSKTRPDWWTSWSWGAIIGLPIFFDLDSSSELFL